MNPIVYRYDDPNAPVCSGTRGSLIALLNACLVDGYGTGTTAKPPAGWSMPFANAARTQACFTGHPRGTQHYLQVDEVTPTIAYTPNILGWETMTSETAGLITMVPPGNPLQAQTSNSANTTARPWLLIADELAFYLNIWNTQTTTAFTVYNNTSVLFFGDLLKNAPNDAHCCGLCSGINYGTIVGRTTQSPQSVGSTSVSYAFLYLSRDAAGNQPAFGVTPNGGGYPGSAAYSGQINVGTPYVPGGQLWLAKSYIPDKAAYSLRGWFPGLLNIGHPIPFSQFEQVDVSGVPYLSVRCSMLGQGEGNYLIGLTDWRV